MFVTGTNEWRRLDAWPPNAVPAADASIFGAGGRLAHRAPRQRPSDAFDEYVSDPEPSRCRTSATSRRGMTRATT